eukprot:356174-Chlamydomonas_euryale.AAC.14
MSEVDRSSASLVRQSWLLAPSVSKMGRLCSLSAYSCAFALISRPTASRASCVKSHDGRMGVAKAPEARPDSSLRGGACASVVAMPALLRSARSMLASCASAVSPRGRACGAAAGWTTATRGGRPATSSAATWSLPLGAGLSGPRSSLTTADWLGRNTSVASPGACSRMRAGTAPAPPPLAHGGPPHERRCAATIRVFVCNLPAGTSIVRAVQRPWDAPHPPPIRATFTNCGCLEGT